MTGKELGQQRVASAEYHGDTLLTEEQATYYRGLTKREYFAGLAMQGRCANSNMMQSVNVIARMSVKDADAILEELAKDQKP